MLSNAGKTPGLDNKALSLTVIYLSPSKDGIPCTSKASRDESLDRKRLLAGSEHDLR
jgi:hypothetical protein